MLPSDVPTAPITYNTTIFLEGPAGSGKTTLARQRLRHLLRAGVPPRSILVLVPQRSLGLPYQAGNSGQEGLPSTESKPASAPDVAFWAPVDVVTMGGLARRTVALFWPLVAADAGFARPQDPPIFLTLETAQYYMSRMAEHVRYYGDLSSVHISPPRLASQVLDNLNKAAVVGFPITEIADRLKRAWAGKSDQARIYDAAQSAAISFREYCLKHNLLDFSLQMELFTNHLLKRPQVQHFLFDQYRHVIADNVEEDTPVAHDLLREWLSLCDSALVVLDQDAGHRIFLGADPDDALTLKGACRHRAESLLPATWHDAATRAVHAFGQRLSEAACPNPGRPPTATPLQSRPWLLHESRFFPQMIDWVADEVSRLTTTQGVPASEIVVLAPYLTDALRFALTNALARYGIATRSHRPSRSLAEEPATRCLLTLAALAHPEWRFCPPAQDVAHALTLAIDGMDLVRATLLTQIVYRPACGKPVLSLFGRIQTEMRERITYRLGTSWDHLCSWLTEPTHADWPLDVFLTLLFDEVLSRSGYGFHRNVDNAAVAARLIESVRKFRQVVPQESLPAERSVGQEYLESVQKGILAATSLIGAESDAVNTPDAVFLAPAYTFLMRNRAVDYQFWLDVGSSGWSERIYQPLTQPYVLSRRFDRRPQHDEGQETARWTDADELRAQRENLARLILGLARRCRKAIYLSIVGLDERGSEQRGPLLRALQRVLRQLGPTPNQ